ncbi:RimJ/RimL family protein N-acetyltransferase [Stackebrandtia albiflava]|uniref:RimJ/RimL family protein N-acetyltransferase n=1 Tax=Stackebrandtia albiflava TaxID=406432 RepID=A0A562V2A2_9ACTN|nr:GNAT family N-acetyltransferase [Stackebrandtia albiflava]TWJ11975.1 RimJ/RimL family protein N-acetyltransferase [Stackebrandtia albiflava]
MTVVRPAHPHEFPVITGETDRDASRAAYLADLLDKGCTRPEWCLVADTGEGVIGGVALWSMPGADTPSDIVLLEAPWDEPGLTTGHLLLERAGHLAAELGATTQGHVLDSPAQAPQEQTHPEARVELLRANGFALARDGYRYRWTPEAGLPEGEDRLTWRSLAELGREPFLDLLTDLLPHTGDALLQSEVDELGARGAAEQLWNDMLGFTYRDEWYEIGYAPDGGAAAISLPARNASYAIIGFVGVAPAHRGNGYASSVVARGTRLLAAAGADEIRGDCDAGNPGMVKGFERAGYTRFATRRQYGRSL